MDIGIAAELKNCYFYCESINYLMDLMPGRAAISAMKIAFLVCSVELSC